MKQELSTPRIHSELKLTLLMNEFLIEFERMRSVPSSSDSFEYIENFIREHFNQDIDMIALSKLSGYSYDHFRHLFKSKLGESPLNYVIKKRVDHAKKLILATEMTMSAIAQDCGFSNSSQFSETFRKVAGVSPSKFKRNHFIR
jgi:AraC-like DNA-binding protein